MWHQQLYVSEKLRELERQKKPLPVPNAEPSAGRSEHRGTPPLIGPFARVTGRRVRRLGEALESWATPARAEG